MFLEKYFAKKSFLKFTGNRSDFTNKQFCVKICLENVNPFYSTGFILYPLKRLENLWYTERDQRHEMGVILTENLKISFHKNYLLAQK